MFIKQLRISVPAGCASQKRPAEESVASYCRHADSMLQALPPCASNFSACV